MAIDRGTREQLHEELCRILGSENVYFQPPETMKIQYPCIIYELGGYKSPHADNRPWQRFWYYKLLYITRFPAEENQLWPWDPFNFENDETDRIVMEKLADLPMCSMETPYTADNLYHYPYTLYY